MTTDQKHIEIQQEISLSRESEELAAEIYSQAGYQVYIQYAKPHAGTLKEVVDNTDAGDCLIFKPDGSSAIVEVKRVSSTNTYSFFQEGRDFFNGIIVDRKDTFDKKINKPDYYLIFNHPMTYACIVNCKNKKDWTVRREPSGNGDGLKDHYISKAIDCQFFKVADKLKQAPLP